jgi:hypothetical protein
MSIASKSRSVLPWAGDGTVVLSVHTVHTWEETLDKKVWVSRGVVVVVIEIWVNGGDTVDTGCVDVADAVLSIVVD